MYYIDLLAALAGAVTLVDKNELKAVVKRLRPFAARRPTGRTKVTVRLSNSDGRSIELVLGEAEADDVTAVLQQALHVSPTNDVLDQWHHRIGLTPLERRHDEREWFAVPDPKDPRPGSGRGSQHAAGPAGEADSLSSDAPGSDIDPIFWGAEPSPEKSAADLGALQGDEFKRREVVLHESVTREQAASLLGVSPQAVSDLVTSRALISLRTGGRMLLPRWQFDADSVRGFVPGLASIADAFPGGIVSLSLWITRPSADLGGRTPREVLVGGHSETGTDRVAAVARELTAAGW